MRRRGLMAVLVAILANAACVKHQPARVGVVPGKIAYHSAPPGSLSEQIRPVVRTSQGNTAAQEAALEQLHSERPELAGLSRRARENPADLDARRALAEAYLNEGLRITALGLYQEILLRSAADISAELGLARTWDELGDYASARQHAERAVSLGPDRAEARELLGRICLHQNDTDAALQAFQSALRLAPENPTLLANTGYLHLLRGEWEEARRHLEKALEIDDSIVEANNHLGIALAQLGDAQGALDRFMAANSPAAALNNLGTVYLAQNRLEEARAVFLRALELQPGYEKARANLRDVESLLPPPIVPPLEPPSVPEQSGMNPPPDPMETAVRACHAPAHAIQANAAASFGGARSLDDILAGARLSPELSRVTLEQGGILHRTPLHGHDFLMAAMNAGKMTFLKF